MRVFVPAMHLLDDDKGAGNEVISNPGGVVEDFQRFFILHFQPLIAHQGAYLSAFARATQ